MIVYRDDLDEAVCSRPGCPHTGGCTELWAHGRCHPKAKLEAVYRFEGVLHIQCAICKKTVFDVAVASRPEFLRGRFPEEPAS